MTACATHGARVCSLCLSTDRVGDHVLPAQQVTARTAGAPAPGR
jgi:hypothetical protein